MMMMMMMMMMMDSGGSRAGDRGRGSGEGIGGGGAAPPIIWDPPPNPLILRSGSATDWPLRNNIRFLRSCVTKFGKMQSLGTASKLSETKKSLKTSKEGINNKENTKVRTDGPTWGRLKRIKIVGFWNLVRLTYFQSSLLLLKTFDIMGWRNLFHTKL